MTEIGDRINATVAQLAAAARGHPPLSDVPADQPTGNRYYLYGFIAVALFTLLVACINYMNLATARAAKRAKEVGMRKILGLEPRRADRAVPRRVDAARGRTGRCSACCSRSSRSAFTPISELLGKQIVVELHDRRRTVLPVERGSRADRRPRRGALSRVLSLRGHARSRRSSAARRAAGAERRPARGARVRAVHDLGRRDRVHARDDLADALHLGICRSASSARTVSTSRCAAWMTISASDAIKTELRPQSRMCSACRGRAGSWVATSPST